MVGPVKMLVGQKKKKNPPKNVHIEVSKLLSAEFDQIWSQSDTWLISTERYGSISERQKSQFKLYLISLLSSHLQFFFSVGTYLAHSSKTRGKCFHKKPRKVVQWMWAVCGWCVAAVLCCCSTQFDGAVDHCSGALVFTVLLYLSVFKKPACDMPTQIQSRRSYLYVIYATPSVKTVWFV